jgi:hypothetical protein
MFYLGFQIYSCLIEMVAWKVVVEFCRNSGTQSNIILEGDSLEIVHVCYELKDNLKVGMKV